MTAALFITSGTDLPVPGGLASLVAFWIVLLVLGTLPPSLGVTLTPSGAVVHNLRRRTIPWADIQAIGIESVLGTRSIVLHETNGRRTELSAPRSGFLAWDRHFEEKFHVIGEWWMNHRGPDWTPTPPPPSPSPTRRDTASTAERDPFAPPPE